MEKDTVRQHALTLVRAQRLAGVGALTASVAHELNNPISIITTTAADLLAQTRAGTLDPDTLHRQLEMIEQNAWRCARLLQTLGTYSHVEQSPIVQSNLNQLIEDSLTLVAYQFQRQDNVEIETNLASGLKPVVWEQNQITQVLVNLLTNARDALRPDGGTITVTSWALPEESAVAFSIRDSGEGIQEGLLAQIFEPFFTTKPIGEGIGLGLAIAAEIVARHRGRIWAENHPEGGACFSVVLPCQPDLTEGESSTWNFI